MRPDGPPVMLAVTSLMGAGHLARALVIARALKAAGAAPVVVSGGRPIAHLDAAGVRVEHLPPVWSDGIDYGRMLTPEGPADEAWLAARAAQLVALFDEIAPAALVTELFPFGRRALSAEFAALLIRAKGRARVCASIRDVLEPKRKPRRAEETAARLRRWYDLVLVHGDAAVIGLGATWPLADGFADMIRYTGYVADPPPAPVAKTGEVLVAVGGGVIGRPLLECAVEAAKGDARPWRLRVGGADAAAEVARLKALAGGAPVAIEPAAPDYRARLSAAACSVSLLGYNTATDLLAAGTPAVIAPMREGGEQEQIIRADAFARLPGFTLLEELTPEALRAAVGAAVAGPAPDPAAVALDGAAETARIVMEGLT